MIYGIKYCSLNSSRQYNLTHGIDKILLFGRIKISLHLNSFQHRTGNIARTCRLINFLFLFYLLVLSCVKVGVNVRNGLLNLSYDSADAVSGKVL